MLSHDVKSLFTNAPIQGALHFVEKILCEFYYSSIEIEPLHLYVRQIAFVFNRIIYCHIEGLGMRS